MSKLILQMKRTVFHYRTGTLLKQKHAVCFKPPAFSVQRKRKEKKKEKKMKITLTVKHSLHQLRKKSIHSDSKQTVLSIFSQGVNI